jgi:hypothetical protein
MAIFYHVNFYSHIFFLLLPEAMTMGKLHKEIGQLIVQSAEDPEKSDSQVIQVIPGSMAFVGVPQQKQGFF